MQLSTTFNPITAYDGGMTGASKADAENAGAKKAGESIVYSSPWLLTQNTQSRKEYLEALERPDSTWDVIRHELFYAHGRWNEDGVDVLATGLSAEELADFITEYEDEQETKAREAASAKSFKPDLDTLIFRKLETPDSEDKRKKGPDYAPESMMEPVIAPPKLETLHPNTLKPRGMA